MSDRATASCTSWTPAAARRSSSSKPAPPSPPHRRPPAAGSSSARPTARFSVSDKPRSPVIGGPQSLSQRPRQLAEPVEDDRNIPSRRLSDRRREDAEQLLAVTGPVEHPSGRRPGAEHLASRQPGHLDEREAGARDDVVERES